MLGWRVFREGAGNRFSEDVDFTTASTPVPLLRYSTSPGVTCMSNVLCSAPRLTSPSIRSVR